MFGIKLICFFATITALSSFTSTNKYFECYFNLLRCIKFPQQGTCSEPGAARDGVVRAARS